MCTGESNHFAGCGHTIYKSTKHCHKHTFTPQIGKCDLWGCINTTWLPANFSGYCPKCLAAEEIARNDAMDKRLRSIVDEVLEDFKRAKKIDEKPIDETAKIAKMLLHKKRVGSEKSNTSETEQKPDKRNEDDDYFTIGSDDEWSIVDEEEIASFDSVHKKAI